MKKILILLVVSLVAFPAISLAHGSLDPNDINTGPQMMQYMEDQVMGDELHEEMEDLMIKMMEGDLSSSETDRLTEIMNDFPGPHGMMMNRMWQDNVSDSQWNNLSRTMPMHYGFGGYWSSLWVWLLMICTFVWLIVGVLLVIYLGKKVGDSENKDRGNKG